MDDIQIVYNAYSQVFEDPIGFEEFSSSLRSDGEFANNILESVVGFDDNTRQAVNRLMEGRSSGAVQEGITYEEKEVVENPKATGFVPEMTDEQYASLPLMDVRRVQWQEWKDSQVKTDPLTSVQDVNQALAEPIAAPSYDNQIATIVNYDEYKRGNFLPEGNYLGEVLAPGTDPQEEIDKREKYLDESGQIKPEEELTLSEETFDIGFFTPYKGSGDDVGAEGFRQAFENSLPEGFKIWTPDNSFMDGRFTMEMLDAMEKSGTKIPDEVKRQKQKGAKQFVIIQDPRGNVHEVKSLFDPGTYDQSPKAAQKAFIKFLGSSLDDTVLQQIKNTTVEQENKVAALFNDALDFSDFSFAPGTTDEQKRNIINSGSNKSGALGLSVDDRIKIQEEVDNISFGTTTRVISGQGGMTGAAGRSTIVIQPYEKELNEALQQLNISDIANGVEREEPLTINSKEVQDLTRENLKLKIENDTKSNKYEDYIEGRTDIETTLDESLIRIYKSRSKIKAVNKAEKANYLTQIAHRQVNNFIENGTNNIKELNNFIDNPTIIYNIKPGEEYVPMEDGRLVPAALVRNAQKEKSILGSKIELAKIEQNNFFNQVAKMTDESEQWDVIKRNYNDGAKFFAQLSMSTADLLINVGYGASKLLEITNPAVYMLKGLGMDSRTVLDNVMMSWQNYKDEVSEEYKKDQEFGEIKTLADVGEYSLQSIASQLPIILSMVATGGLSVAAGEAAGLTAAQLTRLSTISSSSLVGLSSFGGKVSDMNYDEFMTGKDLYSNAEVLLKGLMYGVVEGGLAAVSTAPMISKGIGKVKGFNVGRAVIDEAEELGRRQFLGKFFTKELLPETLTEMGAEGLTTGLQNLIDGRPFLENMTETLFTAGVWGAGMSGSVGVVSFGQRSFANNKELRIIKEANRDVSEYSMKINNLINQKREGKLAPDIDINKEISKLIKLRDQATNTIIEARNQVEINLKDKGIRETQYVNGYTQGLSNMADIRIEAESVANDKTLSTDEKNRQLDALDNQYRETEFYRNIFTDTKTFGDGFAAMAMKAQRSAPFSKARLEYNKAKAEAIVNIRKEKGENYDPTRKEIAEAGSKVIKKREIKEQVKKDKTWANKNGIKYENFETVIQANDFINQEYDKLIKKEQEAGNEANVNTLKQEKLNLMNDLNSKKISGIKTRIGSITIEDNMLTTGLTRTSIHEITHELTDVLINKNPMAFNLMADQIVEYLTYTKQGDILLKMQADNANLTKLPKDANGNPIGTLTSKGFNASELVSSFMENLNKIDLEKMDNQIAMLGMMFNKGLRNATDGSYDIKFSGEEEILNYFKGLGDVIKSGELQPAMAASQTSFSQTDSKLFTEVDKIFASDQSLNNKALEIGNLYRNFVGSRLNKGFRVGKTLIRPRDFDGFNNEVLEDVVSDMATGGSGVPGLVRAYANRDMKRFGSITLPQWINARLNQRILGYLPNDLIRNEISIDSETARQIEDVKAGRFDVDITSARRGVVPESEAREIKPVEDLEIITPELVDEVKDIITKTLKRTALTEGISTESVLTDLNTAIEKEITKVIKSKMGPITRSVLGFAPKQYVDFIKDEMMTIVGSMPTNLIKQKAKSKAWAEVFKLEEIGREDIKKVNPDTGKVTNYRKQIFKLEKPDPQKFQRYFTRGGYTTLIERQRSLIKPMAQQLTRSELARLRQDKSFIQDLADRTGMTDLEVTELFVDNVIQDIESELDNTASEILQQDTVKFSETLAEKGSKNPQIKQDFISGLATTGFRGMLEANFINGSRFPLRDTITQYFYEANIDLKKDEIKQIAKEFSKIDGISKQAQTALKDFDAAEVADLVALTMSNEINFASDYVAMQKALGIQEVKYDYKDRDSVNQGRNLAEKLALAVGPALFNKHFRKGFSGPGGLGGLIVTGVPKGINISKSEFKRTLPTSKIGGKAEAKFDNEGNIIGSIIYKNSDALGLETMFDLLTFRGYNVDIVNNQTLSISQLTRNGKKDLDQINKYAAKGTTARSSLFLGVADLDQNVLNSPAVLKKWGKQEKLSPMKKDEYTKDFYTKDKINGKLWDDLTIKEQLDYSNDLRNRGLNNQKILRNTVEELAQMRRNNELTPEEARWFVFIGSASMSSYIKSAAAFLGYPTLTKAELIERLDLETDDKFVLEHMTPAKRMALQIYRYLLDPSPANKIEFNKELDNFNTILIPDGIDRRILTEAGLRSSMGLNYKTGDPQFETRYKELTKVMQFRLYDGTIVGENSTKFSKMNNNPETKKSNVELVSKSEVIRPSETQNNGITIIESEVLDKALSIARDPDAPIKKIRVFDFDDTLAQSNSLVFYTMPDGTKGELTAEQFAERGSELLLEGADFNFDDFNVVRDGKPGPLLDVAKKIQSARGTEDVFVLTARAPESAQAIQSFLKSVGLEIPIENITGLGNSSGIAKSSWIVNKAAEGYNDFYFADDAIQNVEAVKRALDVIDVKSQVQQAKVKFSETVDQAMNDIIYQKTGIESFKEYSDVRAQAEGRGKRSFDLIPASAEDFGGLLYRMLSKGKVGDAQWEWMQDNLIKPYNRGVNDLVVAQNTLAADFRALKESLEGIPKNLKKKAFGGFTFEDVVRIHTWNKQGITVEGISKRDLKDVDEFVNQNPELDVFSDQLIAITKGDGYYYPGKNWLAGTITTDFREGLRTTSRAKYLAQWQANVDEAFSPKNLNKIEAAFGNKYREALEDSLQRMKTGTNRNQQMGRLESRFLDYINGSVGAVMFLNARSAVLQTISSLNFINWGDNNVFAAGKAFANQPQYWKDFMTLMNSDYLVDRRNGLKINVSENEIAEAAKTSKNKAKAVISTLLSKGFVLTQIADSFAIASGGATFYRNRIKKLMKEGMSEAEATDQAFQDFKEVSETSQQSADPSKISQQQASTIGKIILAWGNTPMQYNRIIKKATLDLVNRRGDWKDNISKIVYYGALQNIIFTTLQTGLFAVAFGEDEEDDAVMQEKTISTINSLIDNLLRGMGIGGAVVSTIKNLGIEIYDRSKRKKPDYADVALKLLDVAPPVDVKVSKFRQGLTTYEYSQRDPRREEFFNIDNPSYSAAAKVIAATTNVPVDRLLQKAQNLEDAMDDQNQWWKRAAMFLGWPEWQLRSSKEASEFKELMKERRKQYKEEKAKRQAAFKVSQMSDVEKASYDREQDSISYVKLNKQEQVDKLDSLGLTKKEIRALRYEKDRVNKLLELMEK